MQKIMKSKRNFTQKLERFLKRTIFKCKQIRDKGLIRHAGIQIYLQNIFL